MADNSPSVPRRVPQATRVYAIGDVHGRRDLLDQLLDAIAVDALSAPTRRVLVMLGDYIDRGDDSFGVMEQLVQLKSGRLLGDFEIHFLMGNHEIMMLDFLADQSNGLWLNNGGEEMLASYGLHPPFTQAQAREHLRNAMPQSHRDVIRDLKYAHTEGDYGFVHAGIMPGVDWDAQSPDHLMWIRKEFLDSDADFGRIVVHGHSPRDEVEVRANRIGLDTRAWASGVLTCLVLEGETRRFLDTRATNQAHIT
ncbi:metallophosphoesterase family protein [Pseudomonadota bacterium]